MSEAYGIAGFASLEISHISIEELDISSTDPSTHDINDYFTRIWLRFLYFFYS
jgi:hypothetical protein